MCTLDLSGPLPPLEESPICQNHRRLMRAFCLLEEIQLARNLRGDLLYGKAVEERIVWRELLDLELQDADDQVERLLTAAQDGCRLGEG